MDSADEMAIKDLAQTSAPSTLEEVRLPETVSELRVIETREMHLTEDMVQGTTRPAHVPEMEYEVPQGYGSTRIVLMVRDPYWLHAYWEIAEDISETVTRALGPDGWLTARKALRVHDVTDVDFDGTNAHWTTHIDVSREASNWYVNVDRPNRSYCAELGLVAQDGRFILLSRSNTVRTPRAGVSEVIDEEWMTISAIERYYPHPTRLPASPEMISAAVERMEREMGSEFVSSISSPFGAGAARRREFWLNAFVEVIVHGATQPDASLTIQGHPVRLRPDGTFAARFALPDGEQVLPIEAASRDGAMRRSITTRISRKTW